MNCIKISKKYLRDNIDSFVEIEDFYFKEDAWSLKNFLISLPKKFNYSFVFEKEKEISGYCIASQKSDSYYIHRFVVAREFIGNGLAKNMMKIALELSKRNNKKFIKLSVHKENKRAISFYSKTDFSVVSSSGDHYIMKLKIL